MEGNILYDGIFTDGTFYKRRGTFGLGEPADCNGIVFTVNSIENGSSYFPSEPGYQYIVVDVTIENQTDEVYKERSQLYLTEMFKVSDSEGYQYDPSLFGNTRGSLEAEIQPQNKLRGQISFEIPTDAEGLTLILKPSQDADAVQFTLT